MRRWPCSEGIGTGMLSAVSSDSLFVTCDAVSTRWRFCDSTWHR